MAFSVTITECVYIEAPPEDVWRFTQSELNRPLWNDYCSSPRIVESRPCRVVRFEGCGRLSGCWTYEANGNGTLWEQTNTLSLENAFHRLLSPYLRFRLRRTIREAMKKVKEALEFSEELSDSLHEDFF